MVAPESGKTDTKLVSGTFPIGQRLWLSGSIAPLQFRFVQNASIAATTLGLGATTVGLHAWMVDTARWRISVYGRLRLPTETGRQYAVTAGVEPGVSALWSPTRRVTVALGASGQALFGVLGGNAVTRVTVQAEADVGVLLRWFEPVMGVEVRVGNDADGSLEYVAPKVGLRFHPGRRWVIALDAMMPLGGVDRTLARAALGVSRAW